MTLRRHASPPTRTVMAHSAYSASLGASDPGRYRRTPPGEPDVAGLVRPGAIIRTSYGTGGIVVEIKQWSFTALTGEIFPHYTIVFVPPDKQHRYRDRDRHWINECVAVHGRILKLFKANPDEVIVEATPAPTSQLSPPIFII